MQWLPGGKGKAPPVVVKGDEAVACAEETAAPSLLQDNGIAKRYPAPISRDIVSPIVTTPSWMR